MGNSNINFESSIMYSKVILILLCDKLFHTCPPVVLKWSPPIVSPYYPLVLELPLLVGSSLCLKVLAASYWPTSDEAALLKGCLVLMAGQVKLVTSLIVPSC